jgi:uncharacterized protein YjeT (DUF2065 family)
MWGKWILRVFTIVYIIEGVVLLFAPESMIKFTRWFADNPRNMRLGGILALAVGITSPSSGYLVSSQPVPTRTNSQAVVPP